MFGPRNRIGSLLLLMLVLLIAGCSKNDGGRPPGGGGGKVQNPPEPEDELPKDPKAREIVLTTTAFATALRAKDLDGMLKDAAVPFLLGSEKKSKRITSTEDLKAELKKMLDALEYPDRYPSNFGVVYNWKEPQLSEADQKRLAPQIEVTGPDGFYVESYARKPGPVNTGTRVRVLVKDVNGKARIVGFIE